MKRVGMSLPFLWLIIGFVIVSGAFYGYRVLLRSDNQIQQTQKIQHLILSKEEAQEIQKSKIAQGNFDESQIKPVNPAEYANAQLHYEKLVNDWGIGAVFIPSSNIHSKILAGMSNKNLMVGLGTYYPNQKLGKGNYVMMAHNLIQGGGVLHDLPQTLVGSVVFATDFTTIFEYVVDVNRTVNQSEGQLLDLPKEVDPALLTVFRCEGNLHTPNRALIQAKFHKSYPASEGSHVVKENLGLEEAESIPFSQAIGDDQNFSDSKKKQVAQETTEKVKQGNRNERDHKKFNVKKPVYNSIERLSIQLFKLVNTSPLFIGLVFILIMFFFVAISNHFRRLGK